MQEGFVRFWRSNQAAQGNPAPFLFAAVRWSALDIVRSRKRREQRERKASETEEQSVPMFETSLERDERRAMIEKAMDKLPIEQREVLIMKIWGDLTFEQIGESLRIPLNTAASRYRYALAALRDELKGKDA